MKNKFNKNSNQTIVWSHYNITYQVHYLHYAYIFLLLLLHSQLITYSIYKSINYQQ